ncbi:MAG: FumA C-terminus/TtdB family hydratase beta subunit [Candidatus Omnitrophota bacterium]
MIHLKTPLDKKILGKLKAGDKVLLSGYIYTARDQAHKRFVDALFKDKKMPIPLRNEVIYYCGPTPAPKGHIIGSCGPTTSSRMDDFTPALLRQGIAATIGKGRRSEKVRLAIKKYKAVYFAAVGGAGAYFAGKVESCKRIAYSDLGPESIYKLKVRDFPVYVAIDQKGHSIY